MEEKGRLKDNNGGLEEVLGCKKSLRRKAGDLPLPQPATPYAYKRRQNKKIRHAGLIGRIAKRVSGERPPPRGFLFVFCSLAFGYGGCLTAPRSGALV